MEERYGIDTAGLHPKPLKDFLGSRFDFIITLCDKATEAFPMFPGDPERIHWSFEDPTTLESEDAQARAFDQTANGLAGRLRIWMSLPDIRRRLDSAGRSD